MKNREKFREEILEWAVVPGRDICDFKRKEVLPHFGKEGCDGISCPWCAIMLNLWLDEEYKEPQKPKVDWSKVEIDTPILVRDAEYENWSRRYFAAYKDGEVYAWVIGKTSWSAVDDKDVTTWNYAKLAESEEN